MLVQILSCSLGNKLCKEKTISMNSNKSLIQLSSLAHFDPKEAGDLSTLFDVGGIVGKHVKFK